MSKTKKCISALLSISIVLLSLCIFPATAAETTAKDFVVQNSILVSYSGESNSLKRVEIPSDLGITAIGKEAFKNAVIGSVVIPEGVTSIDEYAFADCQFLTAVKLPSTLTTVKDYAFSLCNRLNQIYLPSSVTVLGKNIFSSEDFTVWSSGNAAVSEYAAQNGYDYVNTENVAEFGFYISEDENWIPIYTPSSYGHFFKDGYTILDSGKVIDSLPPYLNWSSDNNNFAAANSGLIEWNGEGKAVIKVTDPLTGKTAEFKLVTYYVKTENVRLGDTKKITLSSGESATYIFSPGKTGEFQINSSSSDGSLYFMISDTAGGDILQYGFDSVSVNLNAKKTYAVEVYNLGESEGKSEYTFMIKGEEQSESEVFVFKLNNKNVYYVNGDLTFTIDVPCQYYNGKTYVPFRAFSTAVGISDLKYDAGTGSITFTGAESYTVKMAVGSSECEFTSADGNKMNLKISAPEIINGVTCLPIRDVSTLTGSSIKFDESGYVIASAEEIAEGDVAGYIAAFKAAVK